jgi:hypothetical protein
LAAEIAYLFDHDIELINKKCMKVVYVIKNKVDFSSRFCGIGRNFVI